MPNRKPYDWPAIEQEYRAGQLSLRSITKTYGPSPSTILERAKRYGWVRDLSAQVQQGTNARIVEETGKERDKNPNTVRSRVRSESEVVQDAVERGVEIVLGHRVSIDKARTLMDMLVAELHGASVSREELEEAVAIIASEDAGDDKRRAAALRKLMGQAISLPGRANAARALAGAMKDLVTLERQAYNIDSEGDRGSEGKVPLSERLGALRRRAAIEAADNVEDLTKRRA